MRTAFCILIILAATFGDPTWAEDWTPTRSLRTFSKSAWRGMPLSSVIALAQDSDGVLWLGTFDGVATFDGRSIEPVPDIPEAPRRGSIASILARRKGGVLVATPKGVHVFDGKTWRLIPTQGGPASLAETTDDVLWTTDAAGALWQSGANGSWSQRETPEKAGALAPALDGGLWAATPTGAMSIRGGRIERVEGPPLPGRPTALVAARDGRLWAATQVGTVHWTRGGSDGWHRVSFPESPRNAFRTIAEDRKGRIWAGSPSGVAVFGSADTPWTLWNGLNGPFGSGVLAILGDREGSVWFGLNLTGMVQWLGEGWSHRLIQNPASPIPQVSSAFAVTSGKKPGSVLVAAFNGGFVSLDGEAVRQFSALEGIDHDVRVAAQPDEKTYFAGTRFGIYESHDAGKHFTPTLKLASGFVMGLFKSPDGRWYAGSSTEGVFVRETAGWRPMSDWNSALPNQHIRDMEWRANGELWVGTQRGVTVFREGAPPETITSKTNKALPDSVDAVLDVSPDEIWLGGSGGIGVRRGQTWTKMTAADGLPGPSVFSLAKGSDGSVWVGGSAGVGRYQDGKWTTWDARSGLLQEECNLGGLLVRDDGRVLVGTMAGLAQFDPKVTTPAPPGLKVRWRGTPPIDSDGLARLAAGDRALRLNWTAPWLGPDPVEYRVRLPRLRGEWGEATAEDRLNIENLSQGTWRVEVEARVEGTKAWSDPVALNVFVPPFWYETWPARAGAVLVLLLGARGIYRLRVAALHRHAEQLEAIVHERTAQLAEKVDLLQESEHRALAASKAKSSFLANMSHELRTPLNGILGFAQILARRKGRDAEDAEGLAVIRKSGEHLLGLINNVLSLSKIEAGRVTIEIAAFDLRNLLRDIRDLVRLRADEKGIQLSFEYDEASLPGAVAGDEGRLRQILINLLSNAVKFTERGAVTLRAQWREGRARFEVSDTGLGIRHDDQSRLFEPFVQTESGKRSNEGTGLGLALSRDLARLMGGDITVESHWGKGSTFLVEMNLPKASEESLAETRDQRRVVGLAPGQGPVRVLIVDDLAVNRAVLSRILSSVGVEVLEASSGVEAMATWRAAKPHLIWMDKRMQGIDGLEATRRIREAERFEERERTPIIALSASALEHERSEILAAGCDDFVAKPYRETLIFSKLREHIGLKFVYDDGSQLDGNGEVSGPVGPSSNSTASAASASDATDSSARNRSVLVVDDEWICREMAQEMLRTRGIDVTVAASGQEALDLIEARKFDLVLMDLQMPEMSGAEAARRIRANAGTSRVPLVAMTADSFAGERQRLAETGMDDAIEKPIEATAVVRVLDRWLRA